MVPVTFDVLLSAGRKWGSVDGTSLAKPVVSIGSHLGTEGPQY